MRKPPTHRAAFAIGTGVLALGIAAGLYQSVTAERRLPAVDLNEVVDTHFEEVDTLMERGEYERAVKQLELALALLPRDRELTHDKLGRALMAAERFDEAETHFREAIRLDPDFAEAHHDLGIAHARQGHLDQAAAELREALRLRPDYAAARENLSRIEARRDRPTEPATASAEIERGRTIVRQFYRGELERIHAAASPTFAERLSLDELVALHRQVTRQLGSERAVIDERMTNLPGSRLYLRRARFERSDADVEVLVQLDGDGEIGGLMFRPAEGPAP